MHDALDIAQLRRRHDQLADSADRLAVDQPTAGPTILVQTTLITTYPTAPGAVYAVVPVAISVASETEGAAVTLTAGRNKFFAANIGTAIPAQGTTRKAQLIDGLWVFQFNG